MKIIEQVSDVKRKRYNKNKKKTWRKRVDIKEVEEKLDEERREQRYGGPLGERKDEELMFIDLGEDSGKTDVKPVSFAVDVRPGRGAGFKPRASKIKDTPLKSHMYLKGFMGARSVHKAKTMEGKLNAALKQHKSKLEVRSKKKNLKAKEKMRLKHMNSVKKPKENVISGHLKFGFERDAWTTNDNEFVDSCKKNNVDEDFVEEIVDFVGKVSGIQAFNVPGCRYQKTSALPTIMLPEAGQSYNPAFEDHKVLVEKATRQELKRKKIASSVNRAYKKNLPTKKEAPTKDTWLKEMSEGIPTANSESEEEEEEEEEQQQQVHKERNNKKNKEESNKKTKDEDNKKPKEENNNKTKENIKESKEENNKEIKKENNKRSKETQAETTVTGKRTTARKTIQQRKKEVKKKLRERRRDMKKEKRIRENEVFRIKTFKKEITHSEKLVKARAASRKAYHEQQKSKPLRLGQLKYEPEDIAVTLGTDLKGSLRLAKPAVSLLEERFKNFQRRNLIEPRTKKNTYARTGKKVMKREHRAALEEIEKRAVEALKDDEEAANNRAQKVKPNLKVIG